MNSNPTIKAPGVDRLNSLLLSELAAIAVYDKALATFESSSEADQIGSFAYAHKRSAAALRVSIASLGGTPVDSAGPWGTLAAVVQSSAGLFGKGASLKLLLEGEEHWLDAYRESLEELDAESRKTVEEELLPRQVKHIAALSGLRGPNQALA